MWDKAFKNIDDSGSFSTQANEVKWRTTSWKLETRKHHNSQLKDALSPCPLWINEGKEMCSMTSSLSLFPMSYWWPQFIKTHQNPKLWYSIDKIQVVTFHDCHIWIHVAYKGWYIWQGKLKATTQRPRNLSCMCPSPAQYLQLIHTLFSARTMKIISSMTSEQ